MTSDFSATRKLLLLRRSVLYVQSSRHSLPESFVQVFEVNMADAGYAVSTELRARLATLNATELGALQDWTGSALLEKVGGNRKFTPQFRRFPADVPADTDELWRRRVLSHFMQSANQPCLHCASCGSTHVLNPCRHVVCDVCFDGSNYSACPICGQQVDTTSPFFKPSDARRLPSENIILKLLRLGASLQDDARELFVSMCSRKQAMSPVDKDDFLAIVGDFGAQTLAWLPAAIPVRENVALLFGTLLQAGSPEQAMHAAAAYINTATDVLRLIAAYSGADPALQGTTRYREVDVATVRTFARFRHMFAPEAPELTCTSFNAPQTISRFKVGKLARPVRRALLAFMESLNPDSLTEDMFRHRSYWVWMGEFLHPGEYAKCFPQTAAAFNVIRKKSPDGIAAPGFKSYCAKLEDAAVEKDAPTLTALLLQRSGELARRIDHALRVASGDDQAIDILLRAFEKSAARFATPVLLTLHAMMPTRASPLPARIFWPKGGVSQAVFAQDRRALLPATVIDRIVRATEAELLRRFSALPHFEACIVDSALKDVMAPFNERTASRSAIQLPRGSTLDIAHGKAVRLFLHWCEPQSGARRTDLDLSVGFYSAAWEYLGVCSYYELSLAIGRDTIATSSGDLTSAPYPAGASEFIDIDRALAAKHGIRYAVAVVNNYSGSAFGDLERAYAGVMLRDDLQGQHFDPRSVELKFDLQGGAGIFMPMVFDMRRDRIHWLDVYSRGKLAFNNVANANKAITAICPAMIGYFGSGVRTSMYDLGLLHAAARGQRVTVRGDGRNTVTTRGAGESAGEFLTRLRSGEGESVLPGAVSTTQPLLALLLEGDLVLPPGSRAFVLKPGVTDSAVAASDFIT